MKHYRRLLTIAGSDSGGGAGIQADLKTFSALGCYGMSVITALTAQNTVTVRGIYSVEPAFIAEQIDAVIEDIGVDAVKIGMLHSPEVIRVVAERLRVHGIAKIVVDPVMVAKSGSKLLRDDAVETLKEQLLPIATVITPNLPEASVLLNRNVTEETMEQAAQELAALGPKAVLVKGGHLQGPSSPDALFIKGAPKTVTLRADRVESCNTHGTGCTLSSAIASYLGRGMEIEEAIHRAKQYLTEALKAGSMYQIGKGNGPVHHFYKFWE